MRVAVSHDVPSIAADEQASDHRQQETEQPEFQAAFPVTLQAEHINLHAGKEHQVEDTYLSEDFK